VGAKRGKMTVTSVSTNTYLSDTIILLRDSIRDNVTDPIASSRPANETFCRTSYPQRPVTYPIITIRDVNQSTTRLGIGSELHLVTFTIEIRIWARNVKERDELTQEVINHLRSTYFSGASPKVEANLHDFEVLSAVNVDEPGDGGIKSKVIEIQYSFVLGG